MIGIRSLLPHSREALIVLLSRNQKRVNPDDRVAHLLHSALGEREADLEEHRIATGFFTENLIAHEFLPALPLRVNNLDRGARAGHLVRRLTTQPVVERSCQRLPSSVG